MNRAPDFPLDTSGWPQSIVEVMPQVWTVFLLAMLIGTAFLIAVMAKRTVRYFGRRQYVDDTEFLGSSWDLSAPIVQLLVFLMTFTAGAEYLGFDFGKQLVGFWPKALGGLVIIGGAVLLSTWINRSIKSYWARLNTHNKLDETLIGFSASIVRYGIMGIAILVAMTQFGFAPASLVAIVGATGLAIALALQDTLKAVAAGFMIALFRPFRIGDWVTISNFDGEVVDITPFTTALTQVDNKYVILTNEQVWGGAIVNHSRQPRRRTDLYFDVHYDTDLDTALEVLKQTAKAHPKVLKNPDIWVGVHTLGDWSITLRLRAWTATKDFVQVRADLMKAVKNAFDDENIEIPYPHQVEIGR